MDCSAQRAVTIGKPLTFQQYPYHYTHCNFLWTWDSGSTVYGGHAMCNNRLLTVHLLALRLGYHYPVFIFILIFPDSLCLTFFSTQRCMDLQ